ncbi:GntR family transcriptional regulator [Ochrobactrum sp. RH2CCR150]|uniref:GntR family transcriptional regulator n=1 Tax=Ochrobactrum sp. RH2CCR150 TaxID=2587044 RepID=UPI0015F88061|nr:DNA-binding GntR family transcriptional regulator [Ochrobactrum sp. RH2CCR150]
MNTTTEDTIANKISRVLADRIVTGALAPGAKLRQDHIAEEFGASHVPVREAFRRLEAQGLAVSEARRGVRVASFTLAEVEEVARMRSVLEGLALRHAAPHLTPFLLDEADAINRTGIHANDITEREEANRQFHRLLLTPCDMPRLLAEIDDLHLIGSRFLFVAGRSGWAQRVDSDHESILHCLRMGNVGGAVGTLERHILRLAEKPVARAHMVLSRTT